LNELQSFIQVGVLYIEPALPSVQRREWVAA